eukprot:31013-Pelagococcus_subviridis.AAC.6
MRRAKSLRNGVHHANAVVWGQVYRTHLIVATTSGSTSPCIDGAHPYGVVTGGIPPFGTPLCAAYGLCVGPGSISPFGPVDGGA